MNSIDKLKELDLEGLKAALTSTREEQFRLRFKKSRGDWNQTHLLKQVKTKIAQIKSIKDTDQMAILIHDIEREFNKLKNEDMGDDIIELKQIMKKEVTQSKVCQALLQRGSQKSKTVNNESSQAPYQTSIPVEPSTVTPKNDTEVNLPF